MLQRYADAWRGAEVLPLRQETVLAFRIKGNGGGQFYLALNDKPGGTVKDGLPTEYDIAFELGADVLEEIDENKINALTAMAQAQGTDNPPMLTKMGARFASRPDAEVLLRRLCFYFWTRGWPKTVPFQGTLQRNVHGGNAVVLYYDDRFRSAWYQIKPGMHVNADPRFQKAPFTQLIIGMQGHISAKVDGTVQLLGEGQAVVIPP